MANGGCPISCARCHDHKFDPISQKDYYALYGVFASSVEPSWKDVPILPVALTQHSAWSRPGRELPQMPAQSFKEMWQARKDNKQ